MPSSITASLRGRHKALFRLENGGDRFVLEIILVLLVIGLIIRSVRHPYMTILEGYRSAGFNVNVLRDAVRESRDKV